MYLKNLTVLGFKSFADKTSLNFQPGVTAIVGPNGCGKSNVSDAIRWVLGEQSAKALRGGEMADVIFNGTDGRKPIGMAEVSLTLGGVDDDNLRAAGVEVAYNEVTVTRRIFRDGASEYFVNKVPCRLKDIQQLFMGTGVGRTSYSIMAQGHITQILSSKPEDRRLIFEEAAGITKYKSQKKESLRKLDYTEQNLLRVADLIREVKRQIGSLQRQAGKARRYKQLSRELQHLETQLARHQFDKLQAEINERQNTAAKLRGDIESGSADVSRDENEVGHLRERLAELDHQIGETQRRGLEMKGETEQHQSRIHFNEERLAELASQNSKALLEIAQAEERRNAVSEEVRNLSERLETSELSLVRHRESLHTNQASLAKIEEELRELQEKLRLEQAASFEAAQNLSRVRNEITALELLKQGNKVRLEKLSAEKIQLEEERMPLEARLQEFTANVETKKLNVMEKRGTVEQRQRRLHQIHTEMEKVSTEQEGLFHAQSDKRSRLNVLEQLEGSHEGFDAGAIAAMRRSRSVIGSLAERIRVPDEFVVAIENALGHNLQLVLTEQPESAQQILADLNLSKAGRASIAALAVEIPENQLAFSGDMSPGADAQLLKNHLNRGEVVPALAVLQTDESVGKLVKSLLGKTFIASDLSSATVQLRNGHAGCDFVTLTGDLLNRHGIYTGGYLNGNGNSRAPSSILGRKNQIAELLDVLTTVQSKVADCSRRKGSLQSEQTQLQASLQQEQNELHAQEVTVATQEGELTALQNSLRVLHQKIDTVVYEIQSLVTQEQEESEAKESLSRQLAQFDQADLLSKELVATLGMDLERTRGDRDAAYSSLSENKVALAAEQQLGASMVQQKNAATQRILEFEQMVETRRKECSTFISRKQQFETEIFGSQRKIEEVQHQREQVSNLTSELLTQKQGQETEVSSREEALRVERQRLTDLRQQCGSIDVELAQANMAVENLRSRINEKYHIALEQVRSECITITYADEGPAHVQTLTPEEMDDAGAATDWEAVAKQVEELQKRVDEMGPVNLVAIEEYEETEQRFQFLSKQHDDLVQAKAQLLEVINRINSQTKEMFTRTFEQIRDNFRLMFTEVFGGGKADLVLVDANDVLECGIDIVARPPGKQLQTISLLSGGEQTMTAVSLLFSIYQVKPSPFCVLDELDAPLDESNINRFIRVLQRFVAGSQFIIITHNKRTIGMAGVLYGVTMEEQGVSKIVSVKFRHAEEQSQDFVGRPVVQSFPLSSNKPEVQIVAQP